MLLLKNTKILDANMILRFLLRDNEEMADTAEELIDNNDVLLTLEVAAEVVFVLQKVYEQERSRIADLITRFAGLNNVSVSEYDVLIKGLEIFAENKLDFVDCLLCAYNLHYGYEVCTFDVKLKKLTENLKNE